MRDPMLEHKNDRKASCCCRPVQERERERESKFQPLVLLVMARGMTFSAKLAFVSWGSQKFRRNTITDVCFRVKYSRTRVRRTHWPGRPTRSWSAAVISASSRTGARAASSSSSTTAGTTTSTSSPAPCAAPAGSPSSSAATTGSGRFLFVETHVRDLFVQKGIAPKGDFCVNATCTLHVWASNKSPGLSLSRANAGADPGLGRREGKVKAQARQIKS